MHMLPKNNSIAGSMKAKKADFKTCSRAAKKGQIRYFNCTCLCICKAPKESTNSSGKYQAKISYFLKPLKAVVTTILKQFMSTKTQSILIFYCRFNNFSPRSGNIYNEIVVLKIWLTFASVNLLYFENRALYLISFKCIKRKYLALKYIIG